MPGLINLLLPDFVYLLPKLFGTKKHYGVLILYQLPLFLDMTVYQFHHKESVFVVQKGSRLAKVFFHFALNRGN